MATPPSPRRQFALPPRAEKAVRLVSEGRVTPIPDAVLYQVQGDTSTYIVVLAPGIVLCTCPWDTNRKPDSPHCSHVSAAIIANRKPADPFEGIPSEKDLDR